MPESRMRLRDSTSYQNYNDKHDDYEYEISLKEEFYMKGEYDTEVGVISSMFKDDLINARVYNQLYHDLTQKHARTRFRKTMYIICAFYLSLLIYIYLSRR